VRKNCSDGREKARTSQSHDLEPAKKRKVEVREERDDESWKFGDLKSSAVMQGFEVKKMQDHRLGGGL
jgi:hypothetical protein